MKTLLFMFLLTSLSPLVAHSEAYDVYEEPYSDYQDEIYFDEGDPSSEISPPSDDYYLAEDLELQEDMAYPEYQEEEWSLEEEELPVENYDY